ncbi:MAG TPA: HIT family protein [Tahibacter sp.]|uniref:HIT family protein n=1 Tax=Tahibacter sp. TaxID=2056211 RepID=UPI002C2D5511|nr:HIT family protein [Tahibacter sp.]HSX59991.1 HIT family protein [Tahibacter sp.]
MNADTPFALDPRLAGDCHVVGELELSRVLLMNDLRFPWLILVPRIPGLRELVELERDRQHALLDEINRAAHVLHAMTRPDKMNIATLGNVVGQFHVHVIARHVADAAWPRPVWGIGERMPYTPEESRRVLDLLRTGLALPRSA